MARYELNSSEMAWWLIDNKAEFTTNFNVGFWDLETDDRENNFEAPQTISATITITYSLII